MNYIYSEFSQSLNFFFENRSILFLLFFLSKRCALNIFVVVQFSLENILIILSPFTPSIVFAFDLGCWQVSVLRALFNCDVRLLGSTNPSNSFSVLPLSLSLCLFFYVVPNASSVWLVILNLANISVTILIYFCALA